MTRPTATVILMLLASSTLRNCSLITVVPQGAVTSFAFLYKALRRVMLNTSPLQMFC